MWTLIYDKCDTTEQWRKVSTINGAGKIGHLCIKKEETWPLSHIIHKNQIQMCFVSKGEM